MIFWTKFVQKCCFPSKTEKENTTIKLLHIRISLGTKFQLKLTILIFPNKFTQKGCFQSKTEKLIPGFNSKYSN